MESEKFNDIENKAKRLEALINLSNKIRDKERNTPINFNDFLYMSSLSPGLVFRDIFQHFEDMTRHYIPHADVDTETGTQRIGFADYDCSGLFVEECDNPFFADRLFANRFMTMARNIRKGAQSNRIFLFEGPPGSGKSTFLNNLLKKYEDYTKTPEGIMFSTYWKIEKNLVGGLNHLEKQIRQIVKSTNSFDVEDKEYLNYKKKETIDFYCPNHDHPILQIPVDRRQEFLDELITDKGFKEKLFNSQEYKWVLKDIPCHVCNSLTTQLHNVLGDPLRVFDMIYARPTTYDRQFGRGVSIFNPGDPPIREDITNLKLQDSINNLFGSDEVSLIHSYLARTNQGILALMDIKDQNIDRLNSFHGIISDGVHKVGLIEERIKTLFMGLVNPEDKKHYEDIKSFKDRVITLHIPYVLDYSTEVRIYENKFGNTIKDVFLPRVLDNFAKIIVSSRLVKNYATFSFWLKNINYYKNYIDKDLLLMKMDIYAGRKIGYLLEEDKETYTFDVKKKIIDASAEEGKSGLSGRKSLNLFNNFFSKYSKKNKCIDMEMVVEYFENLNKEETKDIPAYFFESLVKLYNYNIVQEMNEAIYYYNKEQISEDILNYLYAINFETGDNVKCTYTGKEIKITPDFYKDFEAIYTGVTATPKTRELFRKQQHEQYIRHTLSQEINVENKQITQTEQYKELFAKYTTSLKQNALAHYVENNNFKEALMAYGTPKYNKSDERIKRDIELLIKNLQKKFGYTEKGALQISKYVLDNKLVKSE